MAKTRDRITEIADDLFYHHGFANTSFADIAAAVQISRGNFYYHFKTKDQILDAVIARRLADTRSMLAEWASASDEPAERIHSFIDILIRNRGDIEQFGCPVGTLTAEMRKLDHPAGPDANQLFALFRDWLAVQFTRLGHGARAGDLALHLLARVQGIAALMNAFQDPDFTAREVAALHTWLSSLTPPEHAN